MTVAAGFAWRFFWERRAATGRAPAERQASERALARWLRDELVGLGPTFIKVGQALSTRVDLLPLTYVDEMAQLQDRIPPFPTSQARRFIEEELGAPVEALFRHFPDAPIAAASLGQVYRTWLADSGDEVAVKVQRPELLDRFAVDLAALRGLAHYVEKRTRLLPGMELVDILDEFGRKLHEEVDYRLEADNADRFRENFARFPGVRIPRIHRARSSRRVLTMEFMHGTKVTNRDELLGAGLDPEAVTRRVIQANFKQLLEDGFYHADLHPGNILVDKHGNLILVDFGLMGEISRPMRAQMVEAFLHAVSRDIDGLMEDLVLLGFFRPGQDPAPLKPTMAWVVDAALAPMNKRPTFKELTDPLAEMFYIHHLRVPVTFSFIIRTLIALEGLAMILAPTLHMFDVALPYAAKLLLSESGADIRDRLVLEVFTPRGLDWGRLFELVELARRDPGFKLAEVAGLGIEWAVSPAGRSVRDRLLDEFLGDSPIPWDRLEQLIDVAQTDPAFDLMTAARPLVNFLLTPDGAPFRARLLWKIGKDLMTGRLGEWSGVYKLVRALL